MNKQNYSVEEIIQELLEWSKTSEGKKHISDKFYEIQEASEKLREDASIKPEKLKLLIGI